MCVIHLSFPFILWILLGISTFTFPCIFAQQVGAGCAQLNTNPKVHMDIEFLFVDVPKNLRMLRISTSPSDIPAWNKRSSTYFEVMFAFANANLHDDGVLIFVHTSDPEVSRSIHNWAYTKEFYVAEDWFGMIDLDLQSPSNPFKLVNPYQLHLFSFLTSFFHFCIPNSIVHISCKLATSSSSCLCNMSTFWMSGPRTLRTWGTISREMVGSITSPMLRTNRWGKTGCFGEVLVKNVPSSSPSFCPPSRKRTKLSWIGNVTLVCFSSLGLQVNMFNACWVSSYISS